MTIGSLAVLPAGGSITGTHAQGAPLLVFASDRAPDLAPEVYSLALAGGTRRDVSRDAHVDTLQAVHGNEVLFESDRSAPALYTARLGSSAPVRKLVRVPGGTSLVHATWSPGGAEIALALTTLRSGLIELVERSGRRLALLKNAGAGPQPWSADGQRLAYGVQLPGRDVSVIRVADARGRLRFSHAGNEVMWAQAAPRLAFVTEHYSDAGGYSGSTVIADEQGRTLRRLAGVALAFSPDGETLVLARGHAFWLAPVETGTLHRLPSGTTPLPSAAFAPDGRRLEWGLGSAALVVGVSSGRTEAHLPGFGQWFPDSRRLAIVGPFPLNILTVATVGGSVVRRLPLGPAGESVTPPAVTQDGTTLVYTAQSFDVHELYERLPSGDLRQITSLRPTKAGFWSHGDPAPSPDGKLIADVEYLAPCGNCVPREIAVLPVDGSTQSRVVSEPSDTVDAHPSWSPDGTHIAYAANDPSESGITVVGADGSHPVKLAGGSGAADPSWAPDGSAIATARDGIAVMTSDGSDPRRLSDPVPAGNTSRAGSPAWSAGSTTIAFAGGDGLYLVGRDGSGLRRILARPGLTSVAWSPDGAVIAFAACQDARCTGDDIWTVRPDGSDLQRVTNDPADDSAPAWLPAA